MQAGLAQAVCYDGITGDDDACDLAFRDQFAVSVVDGRNRYSYSNMGPQLAADALAQEPNKSFEEISRELLFLPARMGDITYDHTRDAVSRATSYDREGKAYEHDFRILPFAGAGLEGSAEDLVRFGQLHLTGRLPDGRQLLPATSLARLHSAPNGGFYGYGWGRIGAGTPNEVLISDGQVNGGQAMLLINPARRIGAVVISNAAHDEVSALALEAIDAVVPGMAASFALNVQKAQSAHETQMSNFLPPPDFAGAGSILVDGKRLGMKVSIHNDRLTVAVQGDKSEQPKSEVDEGFRGWAVSCPRQIRACRQPGATAKLWLSRDSGGLSGQLQVTSINGQLPFAVRISL
jgi:CubicO group peptidase (beta-lactamase class C family)